MGGIEFYSKNPTTGQGKETKLAGGPVEREELDILLNALSATKDAASMEKTIRAYLSRIVATDKNGERVDGITEVFKTLYSTREKAEQLTPDLKKDLPYEVLNPPNNSANPPKKADYSIPFIKILPAKEGSRDDTIIWIHAPHYGPRDTLFKQPYYKSKSKQ